MSFIKSLNATLKRKTMGIAIHYNPDYIAHPYS